jgi:cobalt-precorrin-5B (C1)-methyltransferase
MARRELRTGFTTGSAAAAAAKAALTLLLGGPAPAVVSIPLPGGGRLEVEVREIVHIAPGRTQATVIKDAGDDPDVTHHAAVVATVGLDDADETGVHLTGGIGVGRVTRPGLAVAVGEPAINPAPRAMISDALAEAWAEAGRPGALAVSVEISVPAGERLAKRTLNPRLGIVGGISILGTTGLVKPFSHEAYTATIESALAVAKAAGLTEVVLTTGRRSEKCAQALRPDLPELAFVQIADYFAFALGKTAELGLVRVGLVSFFGKAVKQAQGLACTHAHRAPLDLAALAGWLAEAGAPSDLTRAVAGANTALHALEMLRQAKALGLVGAVGTRMLAAARDLAGGGLEPWCAILDNGGGTVLYDSRVKGGTA